MNTGFKRSLTQLFHSLMSIHLHESSLKFLVPKRSFLQSLVQDPIHFHLWTTLFQIIQYMLVYFANLCRWELPMIHSLYLQMFRASLTLDLL